MGSRATYAVRRDDGTKLYYSHWGGQHIEDDLLWGPDVAISFIESLETGTADDLLLDTAWCEGGALIDTMKRRFLVFGGEAIGADPDLRNLWLRLARIGWPGWSIAWAYHGMADIADALAVPRERVLGKFSFEKFDAGKLYACHTAGRARMLLSIRENDGDLKHFGFDAPLEYYLLAGPILIDTFARCKPYSVADLKVGKDLPQDALFIDLPRHELIVTLAPVFGNYDPRFLEMIESEWPGWTVKLNYEGLRQHTRVAQLDFDICALSDAEMLRILRQAVCCPSTYDSAASVQRDFTETNEEPGGSFYNHKVVSLSEADRAVRFNKLLSDLKVARD